MPLRRRSRRGDRPDGPRRALPLHDLTARARSGLRDRRDPRGEEVEIVGYEINFNRHFYEYTPPRPLEAIEADIQAIETDIVSMLREVAG